MTIQANLSSVCGSLTDVVIDVWISLDVSGHTSTFINNTWMRFDRSQPAKIPKKSWSLSGMRIDRKNELNLLKTECTSWHKGSSTHNMLQQSKFSDNLQIKNQLKQSILYVAIYIPGNSLSHTEKNNSLSFVMKLAN